MAAEFIPADAPPAVHAQGVLDAVAANPEAFDMLDWFRGPRILDAIHAGIAPELRPDEELSCGTTLCAAGWVCHNAGYKIRGNLGDRGMGRPYVTNYKVTPQAAPDAAPRDIQAVAEQLLGLTEDQSNQLFFTDDDHALAALRRIAAGDQWPPLDDIHDFADVYTCPDPEV